MAILLISLTHIKDICEVKDAYHSDSEKCVPLFEVLLRHTTLNECCLAFLNVLIGQAVNTSIYHVKGIGVNIV